MAKVSSLQELSSTDLTDNNHIVVAINDQLKRIKVSELGSKFTVSANEGAITEALTTVAETRWNSFPSDCQLIDLVTDKIDDYVTESSDPLNLIDPNDMGSIILAFKEFAECIKADEEDTGDLIKALKDYVKDEDILNNLTYIKNESTEEEISAQYNLTKEYLLGIIDIFRDSPDHGYITTMIKTSTGLSKLTTDSSQEVIANALLFVVSRFSRIEVSIVSYPAEIDGGGASI